MGVYILPTKAKATEFCKKKNKTARKYEWTSKKRDVGGYIAYKQKKGTKSKVYESHR